jgi:hypothetical protein
MAKIVEFTLTRDSISDAWPFANTDSTANEAIMAIVSEYNGTIAVDMSEDGLMKTVIMMFPDDADLFVLKDRFETVHDSSPEQKEYIAQMRAEGKYVLSVVAD